MGCGAAVGSPGHRHHCQHQHHDGDPDQVDEEDGEGYIVAGSVCVTDEGSGCRVLNALTHSTHRSCKVSLLKTLFLFLGFQVFSSLSPVHCVVVADGSQTARRSLSLVDLPRNLSIEPTILLSNNNNGDRGIKQIKPPLSYII